MTNLKVYEAGLIYRRLRRVNDDPYHFDTPWLAEGSFIPYEYYNRSRPPMAAGFASRPENGPFWSSRPGHQHPSQ